MQQHALSGRVEGIELHNINKAAGKFRYNIELLVVPASLQPPSPFPMGETVRVRLPRTTQPDAWSAVEKAELGPPAQVLRPKRFAGYEDGQVVNLTVNFTSAGLSHWLADADRSP